MENHKLYLTSKLELKQVFKVFLLLSPLLAFLISYGSEEYASGIIMFLGTLMFFQYGKTECQNDASKYFSIVLLLTKKRGINE